MLIKIRKILICFTDSSLVSLLSPTISLLFNHFSISSFSSSSSLSFFVSLALPYLLPESFSFSRRSLPLFIQPLSCYCWLYFGSQFNVIVTIRGKRKLHHIIEAFIVQSWIIYIFFSLRFFHSFPYKFFLIQKNIFFPFIIVSISIAYCIHKCYTALIQSRSV